MKYDGTSHAAESASPLAQRAAIDTLLVDTHDNPARELSADLSSTPGGPAEPASIGTGILSVAGYAELTAANSNRFRKEVCGALNGHKIVEVDLSQTTTMDCTGLGALIALRNLALARKGAARLMNPPS